MSLDQSNQNLSVCPECFADPGIKKFVEAAATDVECSFCGATAEEPIAAPLDEVVEYIESCLGKEYGNPDECHMMWDSEDHQYLGKSWDSDDILMEVGLELPKDPDSELFEAISRGFENDLWCENEQYRLSDHEQLKYSWREFCNLIKHERRFFFSDYRSSIDDDELFSPGSLLKIIFEYAETIGLIRQLDSGTQLYRARKEPEHKTAMGLGPPPRARAMQNRMSPAGISMMYASQDANTALRETIDGPGDYTVATFVTDRAATIVDFAELPPTPSLFEDIPDSLEYDPRKILMFLNALAVEISRPIERDDRVHIEYVPTQVVTEYLRTTTTKNGLKIDGVRYASSRDHGGSSLVLFADRRNIILPPVEQKRFRDYSVYRDRWIRLAGYEDRVIGADHLDLLKPSVSAPNWP